MIAENWSNGQLPQDSDHVADIPAGLTCTLIGSADNISSTTVEGTLNIGNTSGSTGELDTGSLTSSSGSNVAINSESVLQVTTSGTFSGTVSVLGELEAEGSPNQGSTGLSFTNTSTGTVGSGGYIDTLPGAVSTFALGSSWTIASGGNLHGGTYDVYSPLTISGTVGYPDLDMVVDNDGGTTMNGSLVGTGGIDGDSEIKWEGGTLSLAGGISDVSGTFEATGSDAKTLDCTLTLSNAYDKLDGPAPITLTSAGVIVNNSGNSAPSLTVATSLLGTSDGVGTLINNTTVSLDPSLSPLTISCSYVGGNTNGVASTLEIESGKAGPVTLSGGGTLSGTLALNGGSLTFTGADGTTYEVNGNLDTEYSSGDMITLATAPVSLTVDSGVSADFDHFTFSADTIGGAGEFSIGKDGLHSDDSMLWSGGIMTGTGSTLIGGVSNNGQIVGCTLTISGGTVDSRSLENKGIVTVTGSGFALTDTLHSGGPFITNDDAAQFNIEAWGRGSSPTGVFTNKGTFTISAGAEPTLNTFTQASDGKLVLHLASYPPGPAMLQIGSAASLAGEVDVILDNGFQPPAGSNIPLLSAGSVSGTFATFNIPSGSQLQYSTSGVSLTTA